MICVLIVGVRQRIDSTFVIKWWAITVVRRTAIQPPGLRRTEHF
jgi:hypothetical protein